MIAHISGYAIDKLWIIIGFMFVMLLVSMTCLVVRIEEVKDLKEEIRFLKREKTIRNL